MKTQRFAVVLTVINLLILLFALPRVGQATAQIAPVLRGRSLEIVDARGKVRAQLTVLPASTMPDGKKYPETVLLRLIDPNGRPGVKIGGSVEGSGISLAGDSERREWSGVQILAESTGSSVKLTNRDGKQQLIKPWHPISDKSMKTILEGPYAPAWNRAIVLGTHLSALI